MVEIIEIDSMKALHNDPAWSALQDGKRRARISYYYGYDCTCKHSEACHNRHGCIMCPGGSNRVEDYQLCGPLRRLRSAAHAEWWRVTHKLDRVWVRPLGNSRPECLGWVEYWSTYSRWPADFEHVKTVWLASEPQLFTATTASHLELVTREEVEETKSLIAVLALGDQGDG